MDAAAATVLSELGGIFTFKEEQKMTLQAFHGGRDVFTEWLWQKFSYKHCGVPRLATRLLCTANVTNTCSLPDARLLYHCRLEATNKTVLA